METDQVGQGGSQLGARHDQIDEPMVLEIFRGLEPFRQFFPQGLLDHPPPRKADQSLGLSQDQIPQHGEAGRHPTGGGMGKKGQIEQASAAMPFQGPGDLGHLHQAEHAFLHACPP